jgi:carbonic anhydrase/SulP family sulfate permease
VNRENTSTTAGARGPLADLPRDLVAGLVVFLVALPLCLGVALASGAPLISGVVAGVVGGILVGLASGSHTSVSGPAAGLTAVVAAQIHSLGSFETFLLAVVLAGAVQVALGLARAGFIAAFIPSSVIKGLLAAIGVILILKQIPHVLGHDNDPEGDMAFFQVDRESTFSELFRLVNDIHPGAAAIGLGSIALLVAWDRIKALKASPVPAPLVVVLLGVALSELFRGVGGPWTIGASHLVQVPVADSVAGFAAFLKRPDFGQLANPAVYLAALTIAAVASLETLLNLEAVDKLDPRQRNSPPSRELVAQGLGNVASGLLGGLPVTSVIVRSSVNINAGARTKASAVTHGVLLLVSVVLFPALLNLIPLASLAAILLVTGVKLASPALVRQMWDEGKYQFGPFAATVVAIVLTDLLVGILIGLGISLAFILNSNMRRPVRRYVEHHLGGDVLHIQLANQVSFLNRAALARVLDEVPPGGQVLLDAQATDYIDPDVLDLIRDYAATTGPARGVTVSLRGFRAKYNLDDQIQYVDYSTRELQSAMTPAQVLQVLKDGHERFRTGHQLTRDFGRMVSATAGSQHPLAVVVSCIDSRTPAELIFDVGVGDIFVVRIAGSIAKEKVLGSVEYACAVAGAKLVVVMGHTRCGAVTAAVDMLAAGDTDGHTSSCQHLGAIIREIQKSVDPAGARSLGQMTPEEKEAFVNAVALRNAAHTIEVMRTQSETLDALAREGKIAVVGAMYDVVSGDIQFLATDDLAQEQIPALAARV